MQKTKVKNHFESLFVPVACILGYMFTVIFIYQYQFQETTNINIGISLFFLFVCSCFVVKKSI